MSIRQPDSGRDTEFVIRTDRSQLVNLDVTIAGFIAPRLRAFKDATDSYPADLEDMGEWHAELDRMIEAFENISVMSQDGWAYSDHVQASLRVFARRLGHLWL